MNRVLILMSMAAFAAEPCLATTVGTVENELKVTVTGLN